MNLKKFKNSELRLGLQTLSVGLCKQDNLIKGTTTKSMKLKQTKC
jgi:hypothetical protein